MLRVTHAQLKELIRVSVERKVPLMIWGSPGIGKTYCAKEVAKEQGIDLIDLRLSLFDPTELKGLPAFVDYEGPDGKLLKKTVWTTSDLIPSSGKGILLLDELNMAPELIQAPAYQLLQFRQIGTSVLGDEWGIIATGNKLSDQTPTHMLSSALVNRIMHVELNPPNIDAWVTWALDNALDDRVIGFVISNPGELYKIADITTEEYAFPTPRSWELTSRVILGIEDIQKVQHLAMSLIGTETGSKFVAFVKLSQTIQFEKYLENPKLIKEICDISKIDVLYNFVVNVVKYWKLAKHKISKRAMKKFDSSKKVKLYGIDTFVKLAINMEQREAGALLLRLLKRQNENSFKKQLLSCKDWKLCTEIYGKYLI